jgi:pimeloyl-ACP methyl ester carboxylesterase
MNNHLKKRTVQALALIALATTHSLQSSMYYNLEQRLSSLSMDQMLDLMAESKRQLLNQDFSDLKSCCAMEINLDDEAENKNSSIKLGTVEVGTDNANQPIIFAYLTAGNKRHNKGTIVCADIYFGSKSYKQQSKDWADQGFFVISFDLLGSGQSSYNDPVAMDGVGGFEGYSFHQYAYLMRQALINLDVNPNTTETPIVFTGCDWGAAIGLLWAHLYPDDPYSLSFYIPENGIFSVTVGNDPCSAAALSTDFANTITQLYAQDRCGILCLLYSGNPAAGLPGNFYEPQCPEYGSFLLNESVKYSATTPPNISSRLLLKTFAFDTGPLMAGIPIPVLMLNGSVFQTPINNKVIHVMGLYGMCFGCNTGCTNLNYVSPFPNSSVLYYQYTGIIPHLTRKKEFNKDFAGFITGKISPCDPYLGLKIEGYPCAPCA